MSEQIIAPVPIELLRQELAQADFLRHTNKGGNEIYIVDGRYSPHIMREIGRLREIAFRMAGGGTGTACDIDSFDTMASPCRQLFVWDPDNELILGGYRFILGPDIKIAEDGAPLIATSHMFRFSQRFLREYLPQTIELGRSFVRLEYQSSRAGCKAIFALDNLWDGLGALTVLYPQMKYLFGKFTMYPAYDRECRDLLLHFLNRHFPDAEQLVRPIEPIATQADTAHLDSLLPGTGFRDDYLALNAFIRAHGINIPPLVNAYMSLSPTMRVFGTAINHEFGEVEETGIFLTVAEIFEEKIKRHVASYHPEETVVTNHP